MKEFLSSWRKRHDLPAVPRGLIVYQNVDLATPEPLETPKEFIEFVKAHPRFSALTPETIGAFQEAAQRLAHQGRAVGTVQVFDSREAPR